MKKYLFYISALLVTLTRPMSAAPATAAKALEVEVLIFSGRPNPVFTVTDPSEINEIVGLVNGMPNNSGAAGVVQNPAEQAILGYRGIVVRNLSAGSPELESLVVKRANIHLKRKASGAPKTAQSQIAPAAESPAAASAGSTAAGDAGISELRLDGGVVLERRLLGLARSHGAVDDALISHINSMK